MFTERQKSANEGSINFSPFSRSNGLIEITLLCLPSVLFCTLNNWNREFISVWKEKIVFVIFWLLYFRARSHNAVSRFITPILKSLVVPVIWLAVIDVIYSRIAPFFYLNRIFFPGNEEATLKTKWPIRFQGLFKVTDQIAEKWKTKSIMWQILQVLFPKLLLFPPKRWMNFQTGSVLHQ